MKTILLIGNTGKNKTLNGQTVKVRLYRDTLLKEKVPFKFIELNDFSHHPFSILIKIAKEIKRCDRIVLITAQRGTRLLIPFINFINKKYKKPFVLPMIGISILHKYVDSLNEIDHYNFMNNCDFKNIRPKKQDIEQLKRITWILPENKSVKNVIVNFFGLKNVDVLENFRDFDTLTKNNKFYNGYLNVIYLSRITKKKGIFELIEIVKKINKDIVKIKLDIFGEFYLTNSEIKLFSSRLDDNIRYLGAIDNDKVVETISAYDLFVFPTLYKSEGTPGVIAESFIAGVPILSSDFIQASSLMENNHNSIIYSPATKEELEKGFITLLDNKKLDFLANNIKHENLKYSYSYNRMNFLHFICGCDD